MQHQSIQTAGVTSYGYPTNPISNHVYDIHRENVRLS
jgi:hypothetical protein